MSEDHISKKQADQIIELLEIIAANKSFCISICAASEEQYRETIPMEPVTEEWVIEEMIKSLSDLATTEEVATLLRATPQTVGKLCTNGSIRA